MGAFGGGDRLGGGFYEIEADLSKLKRGLDEAVAEVKAKSAEINRVRAEATARIDTKEFDAQILDLRAKVIRAERDIDIGVKLDDKKKAQIEGELEKLKKKLEEKLTLKTVLDPAGTDKTYNNSISTIRRNVKGLQEDLEKVNRGKAISFEQANQELETLRDTLKDVQATKLERGASAAGVEKDALKVLKEEHAELQEVAHDQEVVYKQRKQDYIDKNKAYLIYDQEYKKKLLEDQRYLVQRVRQRQDKEKELQLQREADKLATKIKETEKKEGLGLFADRAKEVKVQVGLDRARYERVRAELGELTKDKSLTIDTKFDNSPGNLGKFFNSLKGEVNAEGQQIGGLLSKDILPGRFTLPVAGAAGLAPLAASVVGGATSLIGATAQGLAGGAAIGGGLAAGGIANFAGLLPTIKTLKTEYEELSKAHTKYEQAVKKDGPNSKQAALAQAEYNNVLKESDPLVKQLANTFEETTKIWEENTESVKKSLGELLGSFAGISKTLAAPLGQNTSATAGILATRTQAFAGHIQEPQSVKEIASLGQSFNTFLNPALIGLEHFSKALLNIGSTAAHIFGGRVGQDLKDLGEDFEKATTPGDHFNKIIEKLGKEFFDLLKVGEALGSLLGTIFGAAAPEGDKMFKSVANTLNSWNEFLKGTQGKGDLRKYFKESAEVLSKLFPLILKAGQLLGEWSVGLIPFANALLDIAKWATKVVEEVGKAIGLTSPLKTLGAALAGVFVVSKAAEFAKVLKEIYGTLAGMAAIKAIPVLGPLLGKSKTPAGGTAAEAKALGTAAGEGGAITIGGRAASGAIAGLGAESAGTAGAGGASSILGGIGIIPGGVAILGALAVIGGAFVALKKNFLGITTEFEKFGKDAAKPVEKAFRELGNAIASIFGGKKGEDKALHDLGEALDAVGDAAKFAAPYLGKLAEFAGWLALKNILAVLKTVLAPVVEGFSLLGKAFAGVADIAKGKFLPALENVAKIFFTVFDAGFFTSIYNVGKHIVESIVSGIKNGPIGWIEKTLPVKLLKGIASELGLGSPSKKTEKFGKDLADGLAKGFAPVGGTLEGITGRTMAGVQSEIEKGAKKIKGELTGDIRLIGLTGGTEAGTKKATGGIVQYGAAGTHGVDNIPAQMMVGSGEVGAVFTGQQQAVANAYLAPIGGLSGLFSNVNTPHYAGKAAGGYVFPFPRGESFSFMRIDQGQDLQGPAGGNVVAIGPGVVTTGHDAFSGFGGNYAIEQLTGGPWAGKTVYYGHTWDSRTGGVNTGDVIARTQSRADQWTAAPAGWLEFGFFPPGNFGAGAQVAPLLHELASGHFAAGVLAGLKGATEAGLPIIHAPKIGAKGQVGKLAKAVLSKVAASANAKLQSFASPGIGGLAAVAGKGGTPGQNEALGKRMMLAAGYPASEWPFLQDLWTLESGWNANAVNASSGAAGIPQALGHGHVFNLGDARGQIAWGLGYIRERYGNPRKADATEHAQHSYSTGGMFGKPALLVGEHENEYVINPSRADNAEYLHRAAADMGYIVYPAAKGKAPPQPVKHILSGASGGIPIKDLPSLKPFAEVRAIPASEIDPTLKEAVAALKTEKNEYHSVQTKLDKERENLSHTNTRAGRELREALEINKEHLAGAKGTQRDSIKRAKESKARTHALNQQTITAAQHALSTSPNFTYLPGETDPRIKLRQNLQNAQTRAGITEKAANERLKTTEETSAKRVSAIEGSNDRRIKRIEGKLGETHTNSGQKIKHLEEGLKKIKGGGIWEHTQYTGWGTLEKAIREGRDLENKLKAKESQFKTLNTEIGDESHLLSVLQGKWANNKGNKPNEIAERAKIKPLWDKALKERGTHIGELSSLASQSYALGVKFKGSDLYKHYPNKDLDPLIEQAKTEKEKTEDSLVEQEGTEATVVGETPAAAEAATIPSAEQFLEQHEPRKKEIKSLEEAYALAQTQVLPVNPNEAKNRELPGLEGELPAVSAIKDFWQNALGLAVSLQEPTETITDVANQLTSSRSTYFGLVQSIEDAKKNYQTQVFQEGLAVSQQRLELFKNFGSNIFQTTPSNFATLTTGGQTGAALGTKGTEINITNHFAAPPPQPHAWSQGVAWELGAAL